MKMISRTLHLLVALALLGAAIDLNAQSRYLNMKRYGVESGLTNSAITAVLQDKNGYVWIGTSNGLNCFDGYRFKAFAHDPLDPSSIGGNYVTCLHIDRHDRLWIGLLDGKVCRFDMDQERFETFLCYHPIETVRGDVSKIEEDADGNLWVSVDRMGLVLLNPETGRFDRWKSTDRGDTPLSHDALTDFVTDERQNLWIATWGGGIDHFDKQRGTFGTCLEAETDEDATHCCHIQTLLMDRRGMLWAGSTHNGLYRLNSDGTIDRHYAEAPDTNRGPANRTITALAEDGGGNLWVGSAVGLNIYSYDTDRFEIVRSIDATMDFREITTLYCDRSNAMWIGSQKGLYYYNPKSDRIGTIHIEREMTQGYMIAILKDRQGRIWMRNEKHCIRIANAPDGRPVVTDLKDYIADMTVKCFYEDWRGNVWIGYFDDFVTCYHPETDRYEKIMLNDGKERGSGLPFRSTNCFLQDTDSTLWIGTELGLLQYNMRTKTFKTVVQSRHLIFPNEKITTLCRDSQGWLWAGTNHGGLRCYDRAGTLRTIYTARENSTGSLRSNDITCLHEDVEGTLWIGTAEGLCRFDRANDCFVTIHRQGKEGGDAVMGISEDNFGRLWISSSIGILSYDYKKDKFHLYDTDDGVQPGEFNRAVYCKGDDGEILFGGINAVNRFYPNDMPSTTEKTIVLLEDFQIFNKPVPIGPQSVLKQSIVKTRSITLDHSQTTISIQFTVPNSGSQNKVEYAYMLKGADKQWNYPPKGIRYASYANLSPGKYVFCVKAWSNLDVDNEGSTELEIIITPPIWATIWARICYVLIGLALVFALMQYYINKEKKRNQAELEKLEAHQQHEIDELKLQLFTNVSHEFRTSLTLIQSPLEYILGNADMKEGERTDLLEIMHRNVKRLTRLVTQILDFRKQEAGQLTLHKTTQDIVPFMHEVFGMFSFVAQQRQMTYTFDSRIDACLMDFDRDKMEKIVYNLVSNAIKYTHPGGSIGMTLDKETIDGKDWLTLRVADDGIGIDPSEKEAVFGLFYQSTHKHKLQAGGSGLGLSMTRELVRMHDGTIDVESTPGEGSCFIVRLPIVCSNFTDEKAMTGPQATVEMQNVEQPLTNEDPSASGSLILVVEDNPDMQLYIKSLLKQAGYRVRTANDGVEGLAKASELIPDIIVSDVMMPNMNGMEMLQKLKVDKTIGHIPVMMLTAVQDERWVQQSLQMGVDEYVTKPFSASLLKARIANLLARRGEIRQVETYKATYISPFVKQMTEAIVAHMDNPDLNVDQLAGLMLMSPSQLTRKTKALLGTTPYRVVIKTRMEEAQRMMKESELNVSEIAYRCGYQELANFSRSFSSYWKESPTSAMRRIRG
ncbi:MAG: response regulator [Bacteroidales bacterium]|nr:response regulator [Bacteroidales bacterium]